MNKGTLAMLVRHAAFTLVLLISTIYWSTMVLADDTYNEAVNSGTHTFDRFCLACHGADAKGDGPFTSNLVTPVPDLTLLSATNDNVFPWKRVFMSIDGSNKPLAHGASGMPVWGEMFDLRYWDNEEVNADVIVRGRIFELLLYLESIQEIDK